MGIIVLIVLGILGGMLWAIYQILEFIKEGLGCGCIALFLGLIALSFLLRALNLY